MTSISRLLLVFYLCSVGAAAQEDLFRYPPDIPDARVEVYKTIGETKLNLYIFNPPNNTPPASRPAIVFFFGGGWRIGSPSHFAMQCRRLASFGMVAIAVDYRVVSRNNSTVADSVRDAKSAIRYVRQNAARLGIDPQRIAAGGGSSGGHLAAVTGIIPGLDEPAENQEISSRANALVLFNPVLVLAPTPGEENFTQFLSAFAQRRPELGVDSASLSPWHHVSKGDPPTIIFHGKADTGVPYATAEAFTRKMQAYGNRCELVGFDGQNHGFFNYSPSGNKYYDETLRQTEQFLASLGYLKIE